MQRVKFQCTCGWEFEKWLGSPGFAPDAYDSIERMIRKPAGIHPKVIAVMSNLLETHVMIQERDRPGRGIWELPSFMRRPDSEEKADATQKTKPYVYESWKLGVCFSCHAANRHLVVVEASSREILHSIRCPDCGEESVHLYASSSSIPCPQCGEAVIGTVTGRE